MLSSGFANAPISMLLVVYIVAASVLATITDTKHFFYIQVVPHLWRYKQFWRLFIWQACYTNSTEVLFAVITLYQLRIIERLWGTRKFASFLLAMLPYTTLLPPLLLTVLLRPLSLNTLNYLPAGPTSLIFALLAQYHASIPYIYRYRIATSFQSLDPQSSRSSPDDTPGILLTSKSLSYLLPAQLALSQLPGSLVSAVLGWIIGYAWRAELLPFPSSRWRIPGWLYGGHGKPGVREERERVEGLRRRMEGEVASASGVEVDDPTRRRPLGTAILDRFRGTF